MATREKECVAIIDHVKSVLLTTETSVPETQPLLIDKKYKTNAKLCFIPVESEFINLKDIGNKIFYCFM